MDGKESRTVVSSPHKKPPLNELILDEDQVGFVDLDGISVVNTSGDIKHSPLRIQNIYHLVVQNQSQTTTNNLKFSPQTYKSFLTPSC